MAHPDELVISSERGRAANEERIDAALAARRAKLAAGLDELTTLEGPGGVEKVAKFTEEATYVNDCWSDLRRQMADREVGGKKGQ